MEVSLPEAAQLLGRSERSVRYLIKTGQLDARKDGRWWRVAVDRLPLTPERLAQLARKRSKVQGAVAKVLAALPEAARPASPTPRPGRASYSVQDLEVFQAGVHIYHRLRRLRGPQDPEYPGLPDTADSERHLLQGLERLCAGHFHYDPRHKRSAWCEARDAFAVALTHLLIDAEGERLLARELAAEAAACKEPGSADGALAAVEAAEGPEDVEAQLLAIADAMEAELFPGLGGLLRSLKDHT